jgi:hypothetical protein
MVDQFSIACSENTERHAAGAGDWPYYSTVIKYFRSWAAAIEAAGWASRPPGNWRPPPALSAGRAEILAEHNARFPVDQQLVGVYGEQGNKTRPGAYAMRRGHKLREAP